VLGVAGRLAEGGALGVYAATRTAVTHCADASASAPRLQQLDGHGVGAARCTALTERGEFVVARPEALFFYTADSGAGAALLMPGEKRAVLAFGGNMLLLVSAAAGGAGGAEPGAPPATPAGLQLSLYDVRSKLLGYQAPLGDSTHLFAQPGCVTVLLAGGGDGDDGGSAFCLRERDTAAKLELLVARGLFPTALELLGAEAARCGAAGDSEGGRAAAAAADVRRRFGEHLYAKRDFDGALQQFVATIGVVPPSTVIRLFLEARRLGAVTTYLEALHAARGATPEHTTLLLHCYAAERETAKLDAFLAESGAEAGAASGEAREAAYRERFDVATVLRVCRAAGYPAAALAVAERAGQSAARLSIMMDDLGHYDEALALLDALPQAEADEAVSRYGRRLLAARPTATVALLLRACTRAKGPAGLVRAAAAVPLFSERPRQLLRFLTAALHACGGGEEGAAAAAATSVHNTLLELLLAERLVAAPPPAAPATPSRRRGGEEGEEEAEAAEAGGLPDAEADAEEEEDDGDERAAAALALLRDAWPAGAFARYDASHALVLCQTRGCTGGLLFLYERLRMYPELLRCYMAAGDTRGLLDAAARLGAREPALWRDVLTHFGGLDLSSGAAAATLSAADCVAAVRTALGHVERGRLLPPLVVLQALSANGSLPLSVVKDYVRRALEEEAAAVAEDRAACERYEAETARMRAEATDLRTRARVFQNNRCSLCTQTLDLPAAHFMCMHSFHTRCLGENDRECPVCAPENRAIQEVKRALAAAAADQDRFFQALENSDDGFSVVADHFGRGII